MLSEFEETVVGHYDQCVSNGTLEEWAIWADPISRAIFRGFPERAEFIDVGCGTGRFTKILKDLGIRREQYLGVDPSRKSIGWAREHRPGYAFEVGDIYELRRYAGKFQGFALCAVLMYVPRGRLTEALLSLRSCLKEGANGYISTPLGSGRDLGGDGLSIELYQPDELARHLEAAGFGVADMYQANGQMNLCHAWAR